ncbi:engulfment and cell motility protein 3 isoform X3 [Gopherus flavomarginatus]|uniref:engulfment and cell motility protein 3 isoform X3 n=1 Tax=Gopherus flavomarginatus TaxID=286002 RepID=UPI0021CC2AEE|nr:engulfment and cell motility protein 3 isoform X3 [Gopherus flavomarginatus]
MWPRGWTRAAGPGPGPLLCLPHLSPLKSCTSVALRGAENAAGTNWPAALSPSVPCAEPRTDSPRRVRPGLPALCPPLGSLDSSPLSRRRLGARSFRSLHARVTFGAWLFSPLPCPGNWPRLDMMGYLGERNIRQFIHKNIIHASEPMGDEMAHYLYVLQSITLNLLERRMRTPMDPYSQEQRELLQFLRHSAFELESEPSAGTVSAERRRSVCVTEFRKLGFQNYSNPAQDLHLAPPGLLALDNMVYFSRHCPSAYSRFVLENSSRDDKHECPFARSSIQLTLALCEILHVGEPCSETAQAFYLMFFGQDHFFQELFCICIQLQNKTWKEMRATQEDFDKVLQVVREQITRTLSLKPTSLELFKTRVNALNYSEILRLRQTERMHQEETLAVPVLELRERLKPELLQLIRQQRLLRLCEGTLFRKISSRRRQDKLWYCRLSPNHKVLHYGDVEQGVQSAPIESLPEKIPVADIKELLVGRECPHMKEKGSGKHNKDVLDLAFSISYDVEEYYLNFIAPTRYEFCLWTDGLNVLLGREMTSERTQSELDILLSMELKLRLLDLENISIPDTPPPVPNPPSNLNFCYDFSPHEQ